MITLRNVALAGLLFAFSPAKAKVPEIVASVAPVHSLVAAVMEGVGEPQLLVPAMLSDHDYALKPSDVRKIEAADLVVWVGPPLETYLAKPLRTAGVANLELLDSPGVDPRSYGDGGSRGPNDEAPPADGEEAAPTGHQDEHDHLGLDPHVWLDPVRAAAMLEAVAAKLSEIDPGNAAAYSENAVRTIASLNELDAGIRRRLAPLAAKPFITFHDGYSYFVERYGLNQVGQLTVHPEQRLGAASVRSLREAIAASGVVCAFAEPQFDPATLQALAGDTRLKVGTLDAVGANLVPGPSLYIALLRQNAEAIAHCLSSTS